MSGRGNSTWASVKAVNPDWIRDRKIIPLVQFGLQKDPDLPDVPLLTDLATNEDARVQLRNLKTQQAALALNTRRQRMYFDNRAEGPGYNDQLERAARENPLLQGRSNYDPREFDRLFLGNSADENAAMRAIANRIVSQQLAADPAPPALDVTVGGKGIGVDFARSVQIDASRPMRLELEIERERKGGWLYGGLVALIGAAVAGWGRKRRE